MMKKWILCATLAACALSAVAQTTTPEKAQMSETSVVMMHAIHADCAAQFPALKTKLDASFAKFRAQHRDIFNAAEGSSDFDARVERMRGSIDAAKDKARYEDACTKLADSEANWR
jgi:hypothetical protein